MRFTTNIKPSDKETNININLKLEIVGDKTMRIVSQEESTTEKEETNWAIPSFDNVEKLTNFGKEIK